MKGKLSLLKPYMHTSVLKNQANERATYLNIPTAVNLKSLKRDVKLGAAQFAELDKLIEKENEPRYIVLYVNNEEQGYMAVTYLAAGFNEKHSRTDTPTMDWEEILDQSEANLEAWFENYFQIPVISSDSIMNHFSGGGQQNIFSGRWNALCDEDKLPSDPYWMECTNASVCVFADIHFGGIYMGGNMSFQECLCHFRKNDKVYIVVENPLRNDFMETEETLPATWFNLVLSLAADEVFVNLKETEEKNYYKLLLRGFFAAKGLSVSKGFSYERIVNLITDMREEKKCQLIENLVAYAVKDWKDSETRCITNKDFAFMDRFHRVGDFCQRTLGEMARRKKRTGREKLLEELVGIEDVKQQVLRIVDVMKFNQIRARMGLGGEYHNVHVMLGAPGTAKTTVAALMGQIMCEEHLLDDDRFICVNGAELKGMYVGHSAPKVKELFEKYDIIVVDEAYSLVSGYGESDSFSREAIAQLIMELEEHSMDKLVIFAGYGGKKVTEKNNKMKEFLDANPGLRSRITSTIYFDSYSPEDMTRIFRKMLELQNFIMKEDGEQVVYEYFKKRVGDENFGNGREARRLLESATAYAASRVISEDRKKYTREEMQTLLNQDVESAVHQMEWSEEVQNSACREKKYGF